jgi:N6-adenosine-specific RNA methylase IME4
VKRYRTIYADPPWLERGAGQTVRGAQKHYTLMSTPEICSLRVDGVFAGDLAEPDAHLYLWVTNNFLPDGLAVMKAWGFDYKTLLTWGKNRIGLGQYFRGQTEHVLFGTRGSLPYKVVKGTVKKIPTMFPGIEEEVVGEDKRAQGTTLILAPRGEHSVKPEEFRQMIEQVSPGPYLELFARRSVPGWDTWGAESAGITALFGSEGAA